MKEAFSQQMRVVNRNVIALISQPAHVIHRGGGYGCGGQGNNNQVVDDAEEEDQRIAASYGYAHLVKFPNILSTLCMNESVVLVKTNQQKNLHQVNADKNRLSTSIVYAKEFGTYAIKWYDED